MAPSSYDYALIRVVPQVEQGAFINSGVIVFCRTQRFLAAHTSLDQRRLLALFPGVDPLPIERHLASIPLICAGGRSSGPIGQLSQSERFHWLVAPRSAIIQTSAVHSGLCDDPAEALERLHQAMLY